MSEMKREMKNERGRKRERKRKECETYAGQTMSPF